MSSNYNYLDKSNLYLPWPLDEGRSMIINFVNIDYKNLPSDFSISIIISDKIGAHYRYEIKFKRKMPMIKKMKSIKKCEWRKYVKENQR